MNEEQKLEQAKLHSRFHDVITDKQTDQKVVIFGCGSIGSYAALAIFKMGFRNITLIDYDIVEAENIGTQFFHEMDIGQLKCNALEQNLFVMSNSSMAGVQALEHKFEYTQVKDYLALKDYCQDAIIVSAIDSMKARAWLFDLAPTLAARHFIDGRMAIQYLHVLSVNPHDLPSNELYKKTLFSDDEAVQMPCTNKSIGYTAMIAGGVIGKMVKDVATGKAQGFQNFHMDIDALGGECL